MSSERKDTLKKRLDENYTAFIESLQGKTASELIAMAPEITAAQQLHEELLDACDEEDVEFLLRFDDPLEVVCGYWESELTGYDHSGEMGHMLWEIRDRELYEKEQLAQTPEDVGGAVQSENLTERKNPIPARRYAIWATTFGSFGIRASSETKKVRCNVCGMERCFSTSPTKSGRTNCTNFGSCRSNGMKTGAETFGGPCTETSCSTARILKSSGSTIRKFAACTISIVLRKTSAY